MSSLEINLENYLIPLEEIKRAKEKFSQEIGKGGFGVVYKGQLSRRWQNRVVAIKFLLEDSYQGDPEFHNELQMLSRFHHENIISFIGYCDQGKEKIIVSEYATRGSLEDLLRDPYKMRGITWTQRLKICIGVARGLDYLHSGLEEHNRVIHRDVKSGNILLDENFIAKLCDFGLSKWGPKNLPNSELFTKVSGSHFYMDPVYNESHILRKESDVYSFGVVLFEILSGRLAYTKKTSEDDRSEFLVPAVRRHRKNALAKLTDPDIRHQINTHAFEIFKELAYQCITLTLEDRPRMERVIERLEEALTIQVSLERAPAIGIDLGTTYSCVAVWKHEKVQIIPNDQGNRTTPSCVSFTNGGRLIGEAAKNQMHLNPRNTIYDVKRLIGRRFTDAKLQEDLKLLPFKVIKGDKDIPKVMVEYKGEEKEYFMEEISSMVLTKLKDAAEAYLGETVRDAVITVPSYFDDSQRQATRDAGYVAGLNVLQIISEPTSAAIAYRLDTRPDITHDMHVLIFDLGGGTFDVSLVTIDETYQLKVKAVAGDTNIGGQDLDNIMVDHFVKKFNQMHNTNVSWNTKALGRLRESCEKAKRVLSSIVETTIEVDGFDQGVDLSMRITRAKFEHLNNDFFNKCIQMVESCLADAKVDKKNVDEVVLVGGSTRIPKVQELLKDFFNGKELNMRIHVDEAVAYGAAILAAKLSGQRSKNLNNLELFDIVPLSLGVDGFDGSLSVIISRNTPIPAMNQRTYVTNEDNQKHLHFNVYQGERSRAIDNTWLGEFHVVVPLRPKGMSGVNVVFDVDANGVLNCSGEEVTTGLKKNIRINYDKHRISKEEIEKMLKEAEMYKLEDEEHKKKVLAYNELEEYIYIVKRKIRSLEDKKETRIHKDDMAKMENAIEEASKILDENKLLDVDKYEMTLNELKVCATIIVPNFI